MATRKKQFPGRIKALEEAGLIDKQQAADLLDEARYIAGLMLDVRPKLGNVAPEFMATQIERAKCRSLRHCWDKCPPVLDGYRPIGGRPEYLRCSRCEMVRIDIWNSFNRRDRSRYLQPAGYKFSGSDEPITVDDWHVLRRWLSFDLDLELIEIQMELEPA